MNDFEKACMNGTTRTILRTLHRGPASLHHIAGAVRDSQEPNAINAPIPSILSTLQWEGYIILDDTGWRLTSAGYQAIEREYCHA
jgi:hypothetical protein